MNTDTHYNPGGGGTAYAVRNAPPTIQAGDRVRTYSNARPVYGTVVWANTEGDRYQIQLDNGILTVRDAALVTFHGRPHAAFNKGARQ